MKKNLFSECLHCSKDQVNHNSAYLAKLSTDVALITSDGNSFQVSMARGKKEYLNVFFYFNFFTPNEGEAPCNSRIDASFKSLHPPSLSHFKGSQFQVFTLQSFLQPLLTQTEPFCSLHYTLCFLAIFRHFSALCLS